MTQTEVTEPQDQVVEAPLDDPTNDEPAEQETRRNEKSEISFPYSSLEDADAVARAIFEWGGNDVSQDRIAATLQTTVKSSGFRTDVAAARIFGFIDGRGALSLTPLGHKLVDEQTAAQARVDAFKRVPLFRALFEEHQGKVLPGPKGIEAEMLRLGVSSKQVTRARQIFQRSAQHAGFFNSGPERLVEPLTTGSSAAAGKKNGDDDEKPNVLSRRDAVLPPEVALLLQRLLDDGETWPEEDVKAYLAGARAVYKTLIKS